MGPIDYSGAFGGQNPAQAFAQSFGLGAGIQQQRMAMEQQQLAQAEAQRKAAAQEAMQAELATLSANPTPQAIAQMSIKYPQLSEGFKRSYDMLAPEQKQARLSATVPVYAAALNGQPAVAADLLDRQADALKNSGREQEAEQTRAFATLFRDQPESAKQTAGLLLSVVMGPEKFVEAFGKIGAEQRATEMQPSALRQSVAGATRAEAEAVTAQANADPQMIAARLNEQLAKTNQEAVKARFAESKVVQDLKLGEAQIRALAADEQIKRQNVAIAATNAATARAGNDLKRQELQLKLDELVNKRDSAVREKVAQAEQGASNIDNMMNTIERIKRNPALDAVVGPIEGGSLYPQTVIGMQLGTASADDRADAIALIETLGSQAFLSQIPLIKGMGQLSNAEGDKLQSAFQNLTRKQSEKQFRATLDEATRLLNKARGNLAKSAGIELPRPDTPAAPGAKPPLSSFMRP